MNSPSEYFVLLEDSRQQIGKHKNIHAYCEQQGIKIIRSKLVVGDYQISNRADIIVDTKYGVSELAYDIFQSHERFRAELERSRDCGIQLIILTEEKLPGGRLDNWKSPLGRDGKPLHKFDPAILRKAMITMQERYDVKFRFCDGRSTGKVLMAYLKGELK